MEKAAPFPDLSRPAEVFRRYLEIEAVYLGAGRNPATPPP